MSLHESVERKQTTRERFYALQDFLHARIREIRSAPAFVETDFWCDACKRDVETTGYKQVRFPPVGVYFAYYAGLCPKGHQVIRRITDILDDPFFIHSERVKRQQAQFSDEMLQPWQPRFRQVFPKQYAALYDKAHQIN